MKSAPEFKTVRELIQLRSNKILSVNPEYQRGEVWSQSQKRKLVDSVLRGYPIPLIYLHHITRDVSGFKRDDLEVVDGQQRMAALAAYEQGAFTLFDPVKDDREAKFPKFIRDQPCAWAGKSFDDLSQELKDAFLDTKLPVVILDTPEKNEVRDLFVRLQSGLPLNAQETRDSWPGDFTDFVLRLGGKAQVDKYPGHPFFPKLLGMKPDADRGKARQLAAQISVIYFGRRESKLAAISDIGAKSINDFYFSHIDFDRSSSEAKRLIEILDKAVSLLNDGKRPKLRGHDAIHLVLLLDDLWDDYTRSWESKFPAALDKFLESIAKGKLTKNSDQPDEFYLKYAQRTRVNSDRGSEIATRHAFYLEKMRDWLSPLTPKDSTRLFGELDRTILYYQARKRCDVCGAEVAWAEAEVHHVQQHTDGGPTSLDNGALVHKKCHPKAAKEVAAFAAKFPEVKKARMTHISLDLSLLGAKAAKNDFEF